MKKLILLLSTFSFVGVFAQSPYTVAQTEKSNDPEVVKNFIAKYPRHEKTPQFRRKLAMMSTGGSTSTPSAHQPTTARASSKNHNSTAAELNHLLNGSGKSNSAYASVNNLSNCPLVVSFVGKTTHQLDVPAKTSRKILLNKGAYHISTMICGSKYQNTKNINTDYYLTLGSK